MENGKKLRSGFTTGTCAAASAGAAAAFLCSGQAPALMEVVTPAGETARLFVEQAECLPGKTACCMVRKDAGDDPDVTDKALVGARASFAGEPPFGRPCYGDPEYPGLYLTGGKGVGLVTKGGLSCPVGYPAINPVPRKMILREADRARRRAGLAEQGLLLEIFIPDGERLAEQTFNPRLGIEGGISILGTSGVVNPMSEAALIETIRLEIRVKAAEGKTMLAVAPGNYGERFLREETGLPMDAFVKCSNFIGDAFSMMKEEGIRQVLLAGHVGKLVKVAGGVLNTHSRYGDRRMEILSDCAAECGVAPEASAALLGMNTTEEAAEYLVRLGVLAPVMDRVAARVKRVLESESGIETEVLLFSGAGLLAKTERALSYADLLKKAGIIEETI